MMFLLQLLDLSFIQPRETEHPDLTRNVVPCTWSPEVIELGFDSFAHLDDAAGHGAEVIFPLGEEFGVIEDFRGDAGAVGGRV